MTQHNGTVPQIQILNSAKSTGRIRRSPFIRVSPTSMFFPEDVAMILKMDEQTFILLGVLGSTVFIAKKPIGMFGGHRIRVKDNKKKYRSHYLTVKAPELYNIAVGDYKLGKPVTQKTKTEHGAETEIHFFEMLPA
jgi:hypothetical protein